MSLIYVGIYRKPDLLLASYSTSKINFMTSITNMVRSCPLNTQQTYKNSPFAFHIISDKEVIILTMCDQTYQRRIAYKFLQEVQKNFNNTFDVAELKNLRQNSLDRQFKSQLKELLQFHNTEQCDKILTVKQNVKETEVVIHENLEKLLKRGQSLDIIQNQSETMLHISTDLRRNSQTLQSIMWWKNAKFWIFLSLAAIIMIYFGMVYFCGGFALKGCFGGSDQQKPSNNPTPDKPISIQDQNQENNTQRILEIAVKTFLNFQQNN